ncbi:hypothetical protein VKT23_008909 [Stygiomarasmius scandens]|uniref:Hydrophobin n=1 Tax=Marasmiellus scandens TaxID=2682957 RepID=A0ABR1JGT5_9AGAR
MQFKLLTIAAFATLVTATLEVRQTVGQCNTGSLQCCDSVEDAHSDTVQTLLALLGAEVGDITGQVGVTCNPITVIGVSGNNCNAQPVCCEGNNFNGVLALGCTPVNVNV